MDGQPERALAPADPVVAAIAAPAGALGIHMKADQLRLLVKQSHPGAYFAFITGTILYWLMLDYSSVAHLRIWFAALLLVTVARLYSSRIHFPAACTAEEVLRRSRPYRASLHASALTWGVGTVFIMPDSLYAQAVILCVLTGLAGAILSSYSAYRPAANASMLMIMLPITIWLYLRADKLHVGLAVAATIFIYVTLRSARILSHAMQQNLQMGHELKQAHDIADKLARTDALTGINNRRAFFEQGEQMASYCERNGLPLSAIMLDMDHFKRINDSRGHHAGDMALRQLGALLEREFRKSDIVGRLGGEEFAILLPDTPLDQAHALAEKLRITIAAAPVVLDGQPLAITASLGVAAGDYCLESLLPKADAAMYQAKIQGRNCTASAG
jgi:diguanylate cyclase (GGDEF)-like protein